MSTFHNVTPTTTYQPQCCECKRWYEGPSTFYFLNDLGPYCPDCYRRGITLTLWTQTYTLDTSGNE